MKRGEEGSMRASVQPWKRITVLFDHRSGLLICVRVYTKVKLAAALKDLFICHMRTPYLTLLHNAVPLETCSAS